MATLSGRVRNVLVLARDADGSALLGEVVGESSSVFSLFLYNDAMIGVGQHRSVQNERREKGSERLPAGASFGWPRLSNGATDWDLGLYLELLQVPAILRWPSPLGDHQRCFALPMGMDNYDNRNLCTHSWLMAYACDWTYYCIIR
ncbi:hypothetical protein GUJ93_ZPchr0013g35832 [Zizania palustris]|uniref:Uncharacterized protein n=1 Tax=Zizania palustris TaxID=103762 RepID=A0A8J5X2W1_ZIZPA|nr:hypothetical protein GUJ93_ZPchr0013g35832 [Zizania palustris]